MYFVYVNRYKIFQKVWKIKKFCPRKLWKTTVKFLRESDWILSEIATVFITQECRMMLEFSASRNQLQLQLLQGKVTMRTCCNID